MRSPTPPTREWTVLAQDPSVLRAGRPLLARVRTPTERLLPGPRGHRVQVIDYDPASGVLYRPRKTRLQEDPWADHDALDLDELVADPRFHAQNAYAIVMATLFQFERALGRNLRWAFSSGAPQITVAPHGLAEANAFYSRRDEALVFGYFPASGDLDDPEMIFSCLSYDVVAHETTHALLDGLRPSYIRPSSADQAAFHEGFADLVAILSVFRFEEVVRCVLDEHGNRRTLREDEIALERLASSPLLTLAEEMGRGKPLRSSVELAGSSDLLDSDEFQLPHRRGEVLVAAVLQAFLRVWGERLRSLRDDAGADGDQARYNVDRVVEEGSKAAGHLLEMTTRALDYTPPTDITFADWLSAILTADLEVCPDDSRYGYRSILTEAFAGFGIEPASSRRSPAGVWERPDEEVGYDLLHLAEMQRDPVEVHRFLWQNQDALELDAAAATAVEAVRPLTRIGPDGSILRETVASYIQTLELRAGELHRHGIERPEGMPADQRVRLYGGGTLVFDEYGALKYHVGTGVRSSLQSARLRSRWERGDFERPAAPRRFALAHRERSRGARTLVSEAW